MSGLVHWYEGQFLQPQQFQLSQRQWIETARDERRLRTAYSYGLVEARLSRDALAAKRVRFERLRAVMPSGHVVDVPGNTKLEDLSFDEQFASSNEPLVVRLGLPTYVANGANTIALGEKSRAGQIDRLFIEDEDIRVCDDNSGENPQPIGVRRYNARLVIETRADRERASDEHMEWLPVLRIQRENVQRQVIPVEDKYWLPTCLSIGGSDELRIRVRDLAMKIEQTRSDLVKDLKPGFKSDGLKPDQTVKLMRLAMLARYLVRLRAMEPVASPHGIGTDYPGESLHNLYTTMSELMGELAALSPDFDPFVEVPAYNHDAPGKWFYDLDGLVRQWLWPKDRVKHRKIKLDKGESANVFRGERELAPDDITGVTAYFVGIKSKLDPEILRRFVEDNRQFKLVPASQAGPKTEYTGVRLRFEPGRPEELPQEDGLRFFRVARGEASILGGSRTDDLDLRTWQQILSEKKFAVVTLPGVDLQHTALDLYMVLP